MNKRQNVATQSLGDARIVKSGRNNAIDQSPWAQRRESRTYALPGGNFTDYGDFQIARAAGIPTSAIRRAEYGFGKLNIVVYLRNGSQRSFPVEALYPVLEPLPKDRQGVELTARYVISSTQELKEY